MFALLTTYSEVINFLFLNYKFICIQYFQIKMVDDFPFSFIDFAVKQHIKLLTRDKTIRQTAN